jgi:hypothetical protein
MGSMVGGEGRRDFECRFIVTDVAVEGSFFIRVPQWQSAGELSYDPRRLFLIRWIFDGFSAENTL